MLKKYLLTTLLGWMITMNATAIMPDSPVDWTKPELAPLRTFMQQQTIAEKLWPRLRYINQDQLPKPYDLLLTQPLMTAAIAQYYQRTPQIRPPLYVVEDARQQHYSRAILMVVDQNKQRDAALVADKISQSIVAELGLITINSSALPNALMDQVRDSSTPFGALLQQAGIKTHPFHTRYFNVVCQGQLASVLPCNPGSLLYGRTNTLVSDDDNVWVAHTVEIVNKGW